MAEEIKLNYLHINHEEHEDNQGNNESHFWGIEDDKFDLLHGLDWLENEGGKFFGTRNSVPLHIRKGD